MFITDDKTYVVWAGGVEVNNHLITKEEAVQLAQQYKDNGYADVFVENANWLEEEL